MLQFIITVHVAMLEMGHTIESRVHDAVRDRNSERGQTTAEYALVLLGAAAIAMLIVAWATKTNKISTLLDRVLSSVSKAVK